MFARSTTIAAQPSSIDAGIAYVRDEVLPALQDIPGCIGLSLLVDRGSGRCIATSAWDSEDAMRESAEGVRSMRDRAGQMFGGSAQVEQWEIAVLHRDHRSHEGACVRATWMQIDPERIDGSIEFYKSEALSGMERLEGFCSASLMIDRTTGRRVSCATYDSMDALARTRERATALRSGSARQMGGEVVDVCEFELALAHLRVPELV